MPLTSTNLKYKGAFRVSPGTNWQSQLVLNYGGSAIGFNPANNSLFIVGHDWTQCVGEITIPTPKTSAYNTATFIQQPRTIPIPQDAQGDNVKVGGLYVENGNLYGTRYVYYDGSLSATRSHFKLNGTNLNQTAQGLFTVSSPNPGWVAGYIGAIPASERSKFGGKTHFTGMGNLAILSRASNGPAAFAFNLADLGTVNPVSSIPMVGYSVDTPLGGNISNAIYNAADSMRGAVFAEGADTVLFIGVHGKGAYCYGTGQECNDSNDSSKGVHAYPYVPFVWAYSVKDLSDVANGRKQMNQILPTSTWELTDIKKSRASISHSASLSVAYDPATKRMFVAEMYGDGELPLIHVYEIDTGTSTPPADTTAPFISNIQVTGIKETEATITWVTNEAADAQITYKATGGTEVATQVYPALTLNHAVTVRSLNPNTTYTFKINSKDAASNIAVSPESSFVTATPPDVTAPTFTISIESVTQTDLKIKTSVFSEQVNLTGNINGIPLTVLNAAVGNLATWELGNLLPNTLYNISVTATDLSGNSSTVTSQITTLSVPVDPCQDVADQLDLVQSELNVVQQDLNSANDRIVQLLNERSQLLNDKVELEGKLVTANQQVGLLLTEKSALQTEVAALTLERNHAQASLTSLLETLSDLVEDYSP